MTGGTDRIKGKPQFPGKNVGSASGQNAQGNLARREAINNFVNGSIAAADQDHIRAARNGRSGQPLRLARPRGGRQFYLHAGATKDRGALLHHLLPLSRLPPGNRVVDECGFFQGKASDCGRQ